MMWLILNNFYLIGGKRWNSKKYQNIGLVDIIKKLFFRGVLQGKFFTKNKQEILNKFTEEFGDSPTTLVYSRREAAALLGDMFDIVEAKVFRFDDNINLPFLDKVYPLRSLLPKYFYSKLERNFGWNLMIRAKKKC